MSADLHQQQAISAIESGESILLLGRAGTGKSYTLKHWTSITEKTHVLLAPTGVAAVQIGGQTIHSFMGIAPSALPDEVKAKVANLHKSKKQLIKQVETFVIDEISMVRSDLLDCVDITLRVIMQNDLPFGGKQLLLVGDIYQLPPVVKKDEKTMFSSTSILQNGYTSSWFFHANAFLSGFRPRLISLRTAWRQQHDPEFLDLLNAIRNCSISEQQLAIINRQVETNTGSDIDKDKTDRVFLTGTNRRANAINQLRLDNLPSETKTFTANQWGKIEAHNMPVEETLELKKGARVMIARNDQPHLARWVNGTTGTVSGFFSETNPDTNKKTNGVEVTKDQDGKKAKLVPCTWQASRYLLRNNRLERDLVGEFTQIPLRLAWALTIHRAQGKTFQQIRIELANASFAHGQVYVALSRCTHLAGILLLGPLSKKHILLDPMVTSFMANYQVEQARKQQSLEEIIEIIQNAIATEQPIGIDYLSRSDQPSEQLLVPIKLSTIEHKGKEHPCLIATATESAKQSTFNLARVMKVHPLL